MSCGCGKPKCNGKCGISPAVLQINNNECTLFHRVDVPASMGDSITNPPENFSYRNVLLYYEADGNAFLYSSDGIPTKLTGVVGDYNDILNKPSINGTVLIGNKTLAQLGIIDAIDSAVAGEADIRESEDKKLWDEIEVIEAASDVVDVVGTYADLEQYDTSKLQDNDLIKVLADETHGGAITYYRWNKASSQFSYVGSEGPYYTISQTNALLDEKAEQTIFYFNNGSSGNMRSIYKKSNMTDAITMQELVNANNKGPVILRMGFAYDPATYNDAYLVNAFVNPDNQDWEFIFSDGWNAYNFDAQDLTATSLGYYKSQYQGKLTAGSNITISGNTISATDTTYSVMTGASGSTAGASGLVPAPAAGDDTKYLAGDGLWKTITQYSLPIASDTTLGGVKVGSNLSIDSTTGVLSANIPTVNNGTLTIQKNGTDVQTFTANQSTNATANITVPTKTSDLINDSGFIADDTTTICDEGSNITMNGTTVAPLVVNSLKGDTSQNGTPTPSSPIPVQTVTGENVVKVCGKNLVSISSGNNTVLATLPAGTYTFSMDYDYSVGYSLKVGSNSGATIITKYPDGSGRDAATFTISETTSIFINGYSRTAGETYVDGTRNYQLELGNQPTTYEPYQGQSYEVNLGKNLFDKDNLQGHFFYNSNTYQPNSENLDWDCSQFIPVESNTTYTISMALKSGQSYTDGQIIYWDANKAGVGNAWGDIRRTITTGANVKYITVAYNNKRWENVQLELGSQATSYAPYFTPIELCKIGTYQDYIYKSGDKWYVHKEIGKTLFQDLTWDGPFDGYHYMASFTPVADGNYTDALCTHFENKKAYPTADGDFAIRNGGNGISCYSSSNTTLAAWNTWVSTNNPIMYYPLATPTDTEITNAALIAQLEALWDANGYDGQTNIALVAADGNLQAILSVCQYPNHLPVATTSQLGNIIVGHGLEIEQSGRVNVLIDDSLSNTSTNPVQNNTITNALSGKANSADLATVATSGSYGDLSNKPTIPVIAMTTTDPGEGSALAANNFIGVYQ